VNVKKIGTEAAIAGTMVVTALGVGSGVAGADRAIPIRQG
jgi:hypothetical protein